MSSEYPTFFSQEITPEAIEAYQQGVALLSSSFDTLTSSDSPTDKQILVREEFATRCLALENLLYLPMREDLLELERWINARMTPLEDAERQVEALIAELAECGLSSDGVPVQRYQQHFHILRQLAEQNIAASFRARYAELEKKHQVGLKRLLRSVGMRIDGKARDVKQ